MEAIGTLAGGIAHDFNNILTAIIGYSELSYQSTSGNKKQQHYINQVLVGCERAKNLVNQILTFSRQTEHALQPMNVGPIIKETVKLLRASLPSTIQIQLHLNAVEDSVLADPTQIHQVVMNLCTNAAHAMNEGGGLMTIELRNPPAVPGTEITSDQAGKPLLELVVRDTGHGIPPDIMNRIFDPFFTTKETGKGTGMGLSVVHGIVKDHDGLIQVESSINQGSIFRVFLPLLKEKMNKPKLETPFLSPTGNERILWVDDEPALTELGTKLLTLLGYDVKATSSSKEALEWFRDRPDDFDLVITDMTMPYLTGLELTREIIHIRWGIPVILMTGFSEELTVEVLKTAGIKELIRKPFHRDQLAREIRRILDECGQSKTTIGVSCAIKGNSPFISPIAINS
jgi:CheY-like chemotaxis protein